MSILTDQFSELWRAKWLAPLQLCMPTHTAHTFFIWCLSAGVFWGTLLFWLNLPVRRKSTVSLHKGSHWPLLPPAGRPSAPLRAEWISLIRFPAVLLNPTSGTAVISTVPPFGAGPTIPVACGGAPVAPRQGGSAALLQSAPSSRWITWQEVGTPCEPPANQTGWGSRVSRELSIISDRKMEKKSLKKHNGTSWTLSHLQYIQQIGVSPCGKQVTFLCTYVHFVLAQKHISRNTWIMQANSIMWTDGYLLPGSALSDRKKSFNQARYYI